MTSAYGTDPVAADQGYEGAGTREETSLFGFVNVLLKYRGMVGAFVLGFGIFGILQVLDTKPTYATRIGINVATKRDRTSQLDEVMSGGAPAQELGFFREMLVSAPLLSAAAKGPYRVVTPDSVISGPLATFYGFKGRPDQYQHRMAKILADDIRVTGSPETGNMWITVDAPYPDLAQQIAYTLVRQLNDYRDRQRLARAEAEREFVQGRLEEARVELRTAEQQLLEFREENRDFSSPMLGMNEARLERNVAMKQQLYTSLLQLYDRARIEEARNFPPFTLIESPEWPLKPERSSAAAVPLLDAILGLLIGIVLAFIRQRMTETSASPTPAFEHYTELKRQAVRDLRQPLRSFRRVLRPPSDG